MTNTNIGGWIPDKNGFIEGYGITIHNRLTANTGIAFRVYRNGVATPCVFTITSLDNDSYGCVRARNFNINPGSNLNSTDRETYQFKAGERIAVRAEAPAREDITMTIEITKMNLFLYYTYDVVTSETLASQKFGGGDSSGLDEGGGGIIGGGGDEEDPIVV